MFKFNELLLNMEDDNIFKNVSLKVSNYKENNPDKNVISLGVGDVSKPIIDAMHDAVDDLSDSNTFK